MSHFSLLSDLIDLDGVLEKDSTTDLDSRRQRDRRIGRSSQHDRNQPVSQIRAWLREITVGDAHTNGAQGARLYHVLCVVLLVAGLLTGWGLASATLYYDGQQPINVVNAVLVLVLPQVLLLLVWLLTALPVRLPLFSQLGEPLGFLNPGRLTGQLASLFVKRDDRGLALLWHPDNAAVLAPAARWLFSFWSQLFAFSFNIGVLMCAFFLVSSSDLAFVWSTTLTISDAAFQQLLTVFSTPWSAFLPEAVPGAELVSNSRYYRLDEGTLAGAAATPQLASELGKWWPFLIAAVTGYGLLPRLVTLAFSWYRFRHHLGRALCNLPGAPELLARMNSPLVSTLAAEPEQAFKMPANDSTVKQQAGQYALQCAVIDWAGACADEAAMTGLLAAMGIRVKAFYPAGGRQSTEADAALGRSLCRQSREGIGILVRAWEPPTLEVTDFLSALRRQCGDRKPVIVLLMGDADGVTASDRDIWQLMLSQLRDPDLHVEVIGGTV